MNFLVSIIAGLAVGLLIYRWLPILLLFFVVIGLVGLPAIGRNQKWWMIYGAPIIGLTLALVIGNVLE